MAILEISQFEVLDRTRTALGLPPLSTATLDEPLIAALLRRAAAILCPCSAATLTASVIDSLFALTEENTIAATVERVLDSLVVYGDLLELHQVTTDDALAKGTWIFAAPPTFVARSGSRARFLVGVPADDASPLPDSLKARIQYQGCLRVIEEDSGEDLTPVLQEHGLVRISEQSWLKLPRPESAAAHRERYERQLQDQPPSGEVPDLLILHPSRGPSFYRARWVTPKKESGRFVARRPQAYGAPIWGFAQLEGGALVRFLDFPARGSKWRGCDFAWHLQMAIDHGREVPQRYRCRATAQGVVFDFFSPLPLWAERRLSVTGRKADAAHSLMSYLIPPADVPDEESFLRERLWLERIDELKLTS